MSYLWLFLGTRQVAVLARTSSLWTWVRASRRTCDADDQIDLLVGPTAARLDLFSL